MIAAATQWFDDNRSLAVSLVSAGMGVAPMTISPFARWLISTYDWRTAMMTIGLMAWALLIPAALLVRQAPEATPSVPQRALPTIPAAGWSRRPGAALAAVPGAGADLLRLLRRAFRTDLPHGQLRHALRHPGDDRGQHLQCRRPGRAGWPPPARHPRRSARREAGSDRRPAGAGARRSGRYLYVSKLGEFYALAKSCSGPPMAA